jgi:hypothetical protein
LPTLLLGSGSAAISLGTTTYGRANLRSHRRSSSISRTSNRTRNITTTSPGLQALAAGEESRAIASQVNIINSTVGQLPLGNISNIGMFVILDAADRALTRSIPRPWSRRKPAAPQAHAGRRDVADLINSP